jgi:hypothetical protein
MTRILTLIFLLTACGPTNEDVFVQEAAEAACSCYATRPENAQCVADLEPAFEQSLEVVECSSLYRRDKQFSPENTEGCITTLKKGVVDLDEYCRTEEYLNLHPEEDCESEVTPYVFDDDEVCDDFEFTGPWYHETVSLREMCPDVCKN